MKTSDIIKTGCPFLPVLRPRVLWGVSHTDLTVTHLLSYLSMYKQQRIQVGQGHSYVC